MDRLSEGSNRAALIDASFIYDDDFSLARFLRLAELRQKDISCFARADACRVNSGASSLLHPVSIDSGLTCPRLHNHTSLDNPAQYVSIPLCILSAGRGVALLEQGLLTGPNLAIHQLHLGEEHHALFGLQVSSLWSADMWQEHQDHLNQAPEASEALPERFKQAEAWAYSAHKKAHPVYATSSQQIGAKKPCQHEMQEVWAGIKGGIEGFGPSKRSSSLNTAVRTSKVHHSMDGW